jgi:hypothetical protein
MQPEDKALIVGAAGAGLTAAAGYLAGQPGYGALASVVILAVSTALKGYLKPSLIPPA